MTGILQIGRKALSLNLHMMEKTILYMQHKEWNESIIQQRIHRHLKHQKKLRVPMEHKKQVLLKLLVLRASGSIPMIGKTTK